MLCPSFRFSFGDNSVKVLEISLKALLMMGAFFQEILEDDDQAVEAECRGFIQHMETTFGQNIESYFV